MSTQNETCENLLGCLAAEEAALDELLFKLRQQQLILSSGEHRWLPRTTAEVAAALEEVNSASALRERAAGEVNAALGLQAGATILSVTERVDDEAVCQRILQRRHSVRSVLDLVRRCSRQNRDLLAGCLVATEDALALLGECPVYDGAGSVAATGTAGRARIVDARA